MQVVTNSPFQSLVSPFLSIKSPFSLSFLIPLSPSCAVTVSDYPKPTFDTLTCRPTSSKLFREIFGHFLLSLSAADEIVELSYRLKNWNSLRT